MAQQTILNGESGLNVRNALNENFTELYAAVIPYQPILLLNVSANYNQPITAGTFVTDIYIKPVTGSITLNIGTSPNGGEILTDTLVNYTIPIQAMQNFDVSGNLYFTLTGTGSINICIYYVKLV